MRSFLLSLLMFILLLCSCKTKDVSRDIESNERFISDISALNEQAKVDTTKTKKVEQTEEFTRIIERETITEYDTEKQTPSKVTEKTKVTEQGKQTQTDESENRGITEEKNNSTNHIIDADKKVETKEEVKEESAGSSFLPALAKWLGIGIAALIGIAFAFREIKKLLHL